MGLIKPTVGRVVLYHPTDAERARGDADPGDIVVDGQAEPNDQPYAALVTYVHEKESGSFTGLDFNDQPYAALVTYVWHDRMVNVAAFTANGAAFGRTLMTLVQEGDETPAGGAYCTWMLGQAAKTEATERALSDKRADRSHDAKEPSPPVAGA